MDNTRSRIEALVAEPNTKEVVMESASQSFTIDPEKMTVQESIIIALDEKLRYSTAQYDKLLSQKKSSEVRTGKITEQIAPFLEDYPQPPMTARFLGDPVDFIHFNEENIVIVEVKSGKSQLSKKQRKIRDMIRDGKVEFEIYRVKGDTDVNK